MSPLTDLDDTRQTLRQLALTALDAVHSLHDGMTTRHVALTPARRAALNRAVNNLSQIREGFMLSVKTPDITLHSELRDLLGLLVDWSWLNGLGLRWQTDAPLEKLSGQVVLYQHALIALGMIPRLPPHAVTYPNGGYADIPLPGTPGETLSRIDEVERTMWAAGDRPVRGLPRDAVRRTFGFFDATTWLIAVHLKEAIGL
jgi:hypothetical protein